MATQTTQHQTGGQLSSDQVLRIAEQDAAGSYDDLRGYRITLILLPDGWHVDYELSGPANAGGGPHYVIDPGTGSQYLYKRYEQ